MLRSRRLQRVGHNLATEKQQQITISLSSSSVSFINLYLYAFFGFSPLLFLSLFFFRLFVSWDNDKFP